MLEKAVEEMLQREFREDVKVIEAYWTRKGTNMVTAKLRDWGQKRAILKASKSNLKGKNMFSDNDLIWKERQIRRKMRLIAEAEKTKERK